MSKLYGFETIKDFDEQKYLSFISDIKKQIDFTSIVSDSSQYVNFFLNEIKTNDYLVRKHFFQPVQILYFENKKLKSFHINCFAKGKLTNINWNTDNRFSTFIPKSAIDIDTLGVTLENYNNIYKEINLNSDKKYTIIIFWTSVIKKISKSAIQTVIDNLNAFNKVSDTKIYLINTDKFFAGKY